MSESTKMTFGFFDDYFATDSSAVNVPDKTTVTVSLSTTESDKSDLVIQKSLNYNDINEVTEVASDYLKENQKTNTVVIVETDKKENHIVVLSAAGKLEQNEEVIVHSTEEEIGQS